MAAARQSGGSPTRRPGRPRSRPRPDGDPGGDAREGIVRAALELFGQHGVQTVTMAEIAERAGLQQPSLYYYFRSKLDVLRHILDDVNRIPLSIVQRARQADGPMAVRLHWLVYQDVLALCRFPFDINEVHRLSAAHPEEFTRYWVERQQLNDEVEELIAEGIAGGELRDVDPRLAALTVLANDEATQNWFRPVAGRRLAGRKDPSLGDYSAAEIAEQAAGWALRALLVRSASYDAVRARAASFEPPE